MSLSLPRSASRLPLLVAGVLLGCGLGAAGVAGAASPHAAVAPYEPAPDTVVAVEGDAANGFTIHHYDGTTLFPPTDSEANAECGEYDTKVERVRCRTEVRTWYRDLAVLQQALGYAHASA
ncbi:hypothetical protein GCM10022215_21470 [Nocardioides fonticola]|uniref:Secreted protein n=1 Tax=Nocardioides fonticola TaxID=450363 RepID=A0ABP7XIS6_9ACTN